MQNFPHRLVMLYGVSPGAGKTTLSRWLSGALRERGIAVRWIEEEHVMTLPLFANVVRAFEEKSDDLERPILEVAVALVNEHADQATVVITDSVFPSVTWLYAAGRTETQISAFLSDLCLALAPLDPLIVWLDGDVATLLNRAVVERGSQWLEEIVADVDTYRYVPIRPVQGFAEVAAFFNDIRAVQQRLLCDGRFALWQVDVADAPVDAVKDALWQRVLTACGDVDADILD
jgi:thymidylate kinase